MDYTNLDKRVNTNIKTSTKLRQDFSVMCKLVGSDKSEVIRSLMESFIYEMRHNPYIKELPLKWKIREIVITSIKNFTPWYKKRIPPWDNNFPTALDKS